MQITQLAKARKIECDKPNLEIMSKLKPYDVLHSTWPDSSELFIAFCRVYGLRGKFTYCAKKKTWLFYITGRIC